MEYLMEVGMLELMAFLRNSSQSMNIIWFFSKVSSNTKQGKNMQFVKCSIPLLLIVCSLYCSSCSRINGWLGVNDDWWGEELSEDFLEYKTGVDIDFTPDSPER